MSTHTESSRQRPWEPEELRLPCELPRRVPTTSTSVIDYGNDDDDDDARAPGSRVIVIDIA